jgi:hypothetical protein
MELDAGPELERVGQAVRADRRQSRGQDRDDRADRTGLQPEQALDYLGLDEQGVAVADERRIGQNHVAVERVDHAAACRCGAAAAAAGRGDQSRHCQQGG